MKKFVNRFILFFLFGFVLLSVVVYSFKANEFIQEYQTLSLMEARLVNFEEKNFNSTLGVIVEDLFFLSSMYSNSYEYGFNKDEIQTNWVEFLMRRKVYDQIRFIDKNGNEKIRVDKENDGYIRIPEDELQSKKNKEYFIKTCQLKENEYYISKLDLNMENGEVELPFKPTLRLGKPVYINGQLQGVVIINYLANNTLQSFVELSEDSVHAVSLINADGYWISSEHKDMEWAFMFQDKKDESFANYYPELWSKINNMSSNLIKFEDEDKMFKVYKLTIRDILVGFNATDVFPSDLCDFKYLYMVVEMDKNSPAYLMYTRQWSRVFWEAMKDNYVLYILLFLLAFLTSLLIHQREKRINKIKYLSEYDAMTEALNIRAGTERLNKAINELDKYDYLSVFFIDVNGLKEVNDKLGHAMGDELIISVAHSIKQSIRDNDFIIRYGGDEFVLCLTHANKTASIIVWKRIKEKIKLINENEDRPYNISISHGVVCMEGSEKVSSKQIIEEADQKMYEEKERIKKYAVIIKNKEKSDSLNNSQDSL